ncbi:deoxyguanosinetriphosphate triphosphohydrolase family protein [Desulfatibacillum aliphaticivorans]|uniref:deoxyguanosinetriphosphate triphosphohydrolase family protein n=1 Tax=Desulfatibacillum aliphaticivorans TaxID=218208 RepID=UPI000420B01A|nr:HD domain-containing protein [Desulfatibacillum aliphaticivorans]
MEKSEPGLFDILCAQLEQREAETLAPRAALTKDGLRRNPEQRADEGYRQSFSLDVDRILHSRAYTRYIDKTQVFYLIKNDHITHRVLHVQLVSKIARTIGRFLRLNEDLIEAIALGHDIGHAPFGHEGETFLSELCQEHGIGPFLHNVQSVQFLDKVERGGKGWNLCLQTLDGILCHDGEIHNQYLHPVTKMGFDDLERDIRAKLEDPAAQLIPMTAEGCVVRMADTISYIGRDIEDAIRLKLISRDQIPRECAEILGETNGSIVHALVTDIIRNSANGTEISFSAYISDALKKLKQFNLENIYLHKKVKANSATIHKLFRHLFEKFLDDFQKQRRDSAIFTSFLRGKDEAYLTGHRDAEIVRDFLAGMTDHYFLRQCPEEMQPKPAL